MAITTLDGYIASSKQNISIRKTASITSVAVNPFSCFDVAGSPGAGVIAGDNTANGVVPTGATAGCPSILFSTGTGYLTRCDYRSSVASMLNVYDMLWKGGAYTYVAGAPQVTLSAQPSISSRCPDYLGGASFGVGNQIWIEVTTAFATGNAWAVQVTYTDQDGNAGTTPVIPNLAFAALTKGKMFQLPLASGDTGVQKINTVIVTNGSTAMTAGQFNVLILRPLILNLRVPVAGGGDKLDMLRTGMPIIYTDSALIAVPTPDSTATGIWDVTLEIANG